RRNGYEATTMKDIAAAVNLTAASLYHHFRNKDTLLLAVLEAGLEYVISELEPIIDSPRTPEDKLRALIHRHVTAVANNTAVGAAMGFELPPWMAAKAPPANASADDHAAYQEFLMRRNAFFARRDKFEEMFRCVVREGIEQNVFRPVDAGIFVKTMLGAH